MSDKPEILLLSCHNDFSVGLRNQGYSVDKGYLFEPRLSIAKSVSPSCPFRGAGYGFPRPAHSYNVIVYSPCGPLAIPSGAKIKPLPDLARAVQAGTVAIVFLNSLCLDFGTEAVKILAEEDDSGRMTHLDSAHEAAYEFQPRADEVVGYFCESLNAARSLPIETDLSLAKNEIADLSRPALAPFLKSTADWSPLACLAPSDGAPGKDICPILVSRTGEFHAVWVRQEKGGTLFLPEFENNLAVLDALLRLPISKVLEHEKELGPGKEVAAAKDDDQIPAVEEEPGTSNGATHIIDPNKLNRELQGDKGEALNREVKPDEDAFIPFRKAITMSGGVLNRYNLEKAIHQGEPVRVRSEKPSEKRQNVHIQDILRLIKALSPDEAAEEKAAEMFGQLKSMQLAKQPANDRY